MVACASNDAWHRSNPLRTRPMACCDPIWDVFGHSLLNVPHSQAEGIAISDDGCPLLERICYRSHCGCATARVPCESVHWKRYGSHTIAGNGLLYGDDCIPRLITVGRLPSRAIVGYGLWL